MAKVTVRQTASPIRRTKDQRATLAGLGLNKIGRVSTLEDTPSDKELGAALSQAQSSGAAVKAAKPVTQKAKAKKPAAQKAKKPTSQKAKTKR